MLFFSVNNQFRQNTINTVVVELEKSAVSQ